MEKYINEINENIDDQIQFFIDKFVNIGWKQEDFGYITKDLGLEYDLGLVIYPELLVYGDKYHIWIKFEFELDIEYNETIMRKIVRILKDELNKMQLEPFKDEDAYYMNFTRPTKSYIKSAFYLNNEYPNGWWENHTIE